MQSKNISKFLFILLVTQIIFITIFSEYVSTECHSVERLENLNSSSSDYNLALDEIFIRDPNIIYFNGSYFMTGTTAEDGFLGYSSLDLVNWKAEGYIYKRNESNYWAKYLFWAPEIIQYNESFYMFFTGDSDEYKRATGVAVAQHPAGPYKDLMVDPLTPLDYECLDGHLFIHPNGSLYFYYVYEWINNGIGEMWMQEISDDFKYLLGKPNKLFKGNDARWSNFLIDGPSMIFFENMYYLFWSSYNKRNFGKYCVGYGHSSSPHGPFTMEKTPILKQDGGHSTWFFEEGNSNLTRYITYHQPNSKTEHAVIKLLNWNENREIWFIYPPEQNYVILVTLGVVFLGFSLYVFWFIRKRVVTK